MADTALVHLTTLMPRDRLVATIVSVGTAIQRPGAPSGYVIREGWHSWQFMLTLRGDGEAEVDGHVLAIPAGAAVLLPRDRAHRYRRVPSCPHWEYRWVEFDGEQVPSLLRMLGLGDAWCVPLCSQVRPTIASVHDLLLSRGDEALGQAATLFMHALAAVAHRARQRPEAAPSAVERAVAWMSLHLHRQVQLSDLTRASGVSLRHCVRLFHATHGVPPMVYLRLLRVNRAKALLTQGDLRINQIARAVGYEHVQHFTRMFSREVGMSPRAFRQGSTRTGRQPDQPTLG